MNPASIALKLESTGSHDQLVVTGDVSLSGDLDLTLDFAPAGAHYFLLLDNQGSNAISGEFNGRVEGSQFFLDYNGTDYPVHDHLSRRHWQRRHTGRRARAGQPGPAGPGLPRPARRGDVLAAGGPTGKAA